MGVRGHFSPVMLLSIRYEHTHTHILTETAERKPPHIQYEGLEMKAQQLFEFNDGLISDPPLA